jgi:AbrB family looped-hinge helix DNA binding protein
VGGGFNINHQFKKGRGEQMALMRAFSKVDKEGKISIPSNIRRQVDLKEGQLVEIKLAGGNRAHHIVIHKRHAAR